MADMNPVRTPMPSQDPDIRRRNFDEVTLGYTEEMAVAEAKRCLNCRHRPCTGGCPVGIRIPDFIAKVAEGEFEEAYHIIHEDSSLPAVCGRVCPQERQCEKYCVRGMKGDSVGIGRLERFVADWHASHGRESVKKQPVNAHKVAVVGAGPSGLTCAGDLAKKGYDVTVFEALHVPGGVLVYGIPEFRLPKAIVAREVDTLRALGVRIETNVVVGRSITIDELLEDEGFEAVFIGTGAGLPSFMKIPGESLKGVFSANEFLTRVNLMKAYREDSDTPILRPSRVAVVGGGNVAMDAARSAMRLGAGRVTVLYRRGEEEMPARKEEIEHAKEEGVEFMFLTAPTQILGTEGNEDRSRNGFVRGVRCIRMELGESDASGRRRPKEIPGSEFELEADAVIMALGTSPNPLISRTTHDLETDRRGCIVADPETGETSRPGVFAGGDTVTGAATVILAMGAGKKAAAAIDRYITEGGKG